MGKSPSRRQSEGAEPTGPGPRPFLRITGRHADGRWLLPVAVLAGAVCGLVVAAFIGGMNHSPEIEGQIYIWGGAIGAAAGAAAWAVTWLVLRASQRRLSLLATHDSLTGLANHPYFLRRLEEELGRARREVQPLSLIVMDFDDFKAINDTYGHGVGNEVLAATGADIAAGLRAFDLAGRIGGEEFASSTPVSWRRSSPSSTGVAIVKRRRTVATPLTTPPAAMPETTPRRPAACEPRGRPRHTHPAAAPEGMGSAALRE